MQESMEGIGLNREMIPQENPSAEVKLLLLTGKLFFSLTLPNFQEKKNSIEEWLKAVNPNGADENMEKERTEIKGTPEWNRKYEMMDKLYNEKLLKVQNQPETIRLRNEIARAQHELNLHLIRPAWFRAMNSDSYQAHLKLHVEKKFKTEFDYVNHVKLEVLGV